MITVQRAYERLEHEGLIHSRRGKGFFVSALSQETKRTMARQRLMENLRPRIDAALAEGLRTEDIHEIVEVILRERAVSPQA